MAYWSDYSYVSAAEKKAIAKRAIDKRKKGGLQPQPVVITGRGIAKSFWGKGWCDHLESFSDYSNRLPRGRTYARNGSVCHLEVGAGVVKALVAGSSLYEVDVKIEPLADEAWEKVKSDCSGQIGTLVELLMGKISEEVMSIVSDRHTGLFPKPKEIRFDCDCPDGARMCKHIAAVLYGVGSRLDESPELLFVLRGVDAEELIKVEFSQTVERGEDDLPDEVLSDIFGIDLEFDLDRVLSEAGGELKSGRDVAELRGRLGLSLEEFAARVGYAESTCRRWEASQELKIGKKARGVLEGLLE